MLSLKKVTSSFLIFSLLIFILLNPALSVDAARYGLLLWFNTIIPTLFLFVLLSNMIISLDAVSYITFWIYPILHRLFGISSYGCYAVIIGFLCGYPMGAKVTCDLFSNRLVSKKESLFLLLFTNNASPIFIISYIIGLYFNNYQKKYLIIIIMYAIPVIIAIIGKIFFNSKNFSDFTSAKENESISKNNSPAMQRLDFSIMDNAIVNAFETMVRLGGYIILFSLISKIIICFPYLPSMFKYLLVMFTEITTGAAYINSCGISEAHKLIITLSGVSFGGLSCIFQSLGMIKEANLPPAGFIIGKILSGILAFIITSVLLPK